MNEQERTKTSRFISLLLRHHPELIGLQIDRHGWADVHALIDGVNQTGQYHLTIPLLKEIVQKDEKQRYAFNGDQTKIRANQGHSIPVEIEMKREVPPSLLYHGTSEKSVASIERQGILPMSRLYVHLSKDIETARKVGGRHGKPVVYQIDAAQMHQDGIGFFLSANGIWMVKEVPVQYIRKMNEGRQETA